MHKVIDKQYTFVLFSPVFVYTESRSACTEPRSANQNLRLGSAFPRCCRPSVRSDVQSSPTFQRFDVQTCQRLDVFCSLPLFPCRPTPTPHYPPKLLRINTYKSLSKQRTLTLRRIYTYKKDGGVLWSTNFLLSSNVPTRLQPSFVLNRFHTLSFSVSCNSCICLPAVAGHSYENRGGVYQLFPFWNTFNRAGARDHSSPRCLCALSVSALSFSVLRFLTFNFELSIEDPERLGTVNFPPPLSRYFITSLLHYFLLSCATLECCITAQFHDHATSISGDPRPPQRGQVHALQSLDRHAPLHRHQRTRHHPRPHLRQGRVARPRPGNRGHRRHRSGRQGLDPPGNPAPGPRRHQESRSPRTGRGQPGRPYASRRRAGAPPAHYGQALRDRRQQSGRPIAGSQCRRLSPHRRADFSDRRRTRHRRRRSS